MSPQKPRAPSETAPADLALIAALRHTQAKLEAQLEALRYSQRTAEGAVERFVTLFANVPLALLVVDARGQILQFNAHALALLQPQEADPPLHYLWPLIDAAHTERVAHGLTQAQELGRWVVEELSVLAGSNGPLVGDLHISFLENASEDGDGFLCALVDQTPQIAQRQALQAQAELERQLREAQKLQAIGTLAGGIAHDFNNILSAILGNTRLAQAEAPLPESVLASLHEIDKAARRARELVRQILTFSRNEPTQRSRLSLAEATGNAVGLFRVSLPPQVALDVHIASADTAIEADPTQIEQVLLNLLTNALHALGDAPGQISVHVARDDQRVWLRVSDTGCGIAPELQARVFEPFFTTKPVGQGTGLGLSVVHGIAQAHEALLHLQSAPGQGSTFALGFIPAPAQAPTLAQIDADPAPALAPMPSAEPATQPGPASPARVVYVDDDAALVFLVERVFRRQGWGVRCFDDARAALAWLQTNPQGCDALVTDYNMPGFSGVQLLQALQTLRPDLPCALASGYLTAEIEAAARAAGARALIHKPDDVDALVDAVRKLLSAAPPT